MAHRIVWNLENGEILARLAGTPTRWPASPSRRTARASPPRDATLRLWDLATGQELDVLEGHTDAVLSVAAVPMARAVQRRTARCACGTWTPARISRPEGHTDAVLSVAFSPDGTRALSGAGRHLRLWDLDTGQEIRRFEGHTGGVTSVAFSADGLQALSASRDGSVRLWSIERGRNCCLLGHSDADQRGLQPRWPRRALRLADMTLRL